MHPSRPRARLPLALACALALGHLPAALAQTGLPPTSEQTRTFDIPAGPLASALNQLATSAGISLSFDPAIAAGRQSPALKGQYSPAEALTRLLQGSDLAWRERSAGAFSIERLDTDGDDVLVTSELSVEGASTANPGYQGLSSYDQAALRAVPARKGQITSLLRLNPAVQFDNSADSSRSPAELAPADISIHGAKFWQNQFMVDGISVNNDINPGDRSYYNVNGSDTDLPGNKSQGIALDTHLLQRVDVYDSNVSAEYGSFNGGVVNAVTRDPSRELAGSLSLTTSRDSWTKYHIDDRVAEAFYNNPSNANGYVLDHPEFKTMIYRATLEGHVSDTLGLLGSFTRKQSDIYNQRVVNADMAASGSRIGEFTDVEKRIDNVFLKGVWTPSDRLRIETTLTHEPQESQHFTINAMQGDFLMESGGSAAGTVLTWRGDHSTQTHRINWSRMRHSRTGGPGWYQVWYYSEDDKKWGDPSVDGPWGTMFGTFGNIHQGQSNLEYRFKQEWDPLDTAAVSHRLAIGAHIGEAKGWYERKQDHTQGVPWEWAPTFTCTDVNGQVDDRHCSTAPVLHLPEGWPAGSGQMAMARNIFRAGKIDITQQQWSVWAEDAMKIRRFDLRLGARVDSDDYMDQTNIAPRIAAQYDFFGDGRTRLVAGANRYYGRNLYEYALAAQRQRMHYEQVRDPDTLLWSEPQRTTLSTTVFNQLDVPYDDEWVLGLRQIAWGTDFDLKYVQRKGRDQIVRQRLRGAHPDPQVDQSSHYEYVNAGQSRTDSILLTISPLRSFQFGDTFTTGQLIANWTDVTSSHASYNTTFDPVADNAWIRYEGEFIRYYERPANNYNRPWTLRISTLTEIPGWNLSIGNYLSWRGSYKRVIRTGAVVEYRGQPADVYEEQTFSTSATWDMRVMWERAVAGRSTVFANLDITNLLDRNNIATWGSSEVLYEIGRQFTLEVDYRF